MGLVPSSVHVLRELSEKTFGVVCENVMRELLSVRARKMIIKLRFSWETDQVP